MIIKLHQRAAKTRQERDGENRTAKFRKVLETKAFKKFTGEIMWFDLEACNDLKKIMMCSLWNEKLHCYFTSVCKQALQINIYNWYNWDLRVVKNYLCFFRLHILVW